jgi:hypothetical protein
MTKGEAGKAIQAAMQQRSISFTELSDQLGAPRVWLAAAVFGP